MAHGSLNLPAAQACTLAISHPGALRAASRGRASFQAALAPAPRAKSSAAVLVPEADTSRILDTELHVEAETSYIAVRLADAQARGEPA